MASKPKPEPTSDSEPAILADYRPVPQTKARADGWTAARQRRFLTVLAETGCVSEACNWSGVSSRSAYRLRQRADAGAFSAAWDQALRLATVRLTTVAYERAIRGTVKEIWKGGELAGTTRMPSDKLLVSLLGHLLPRGDAPSRLDAFDANVDAIRTGFAGTLDRLADNPVEMVAIQSRDFFPEGPGDWTEDW